MQVKNVLHVLGALVGGLLYSSYAPAAPEVHVENSAVIDRPIMGDNLTPISDFLVSSVGKRTSVDLIINSPGGSVSSGFAFLNRLDYVRSRGIVVNCFVPEMAASMAFQILLHCDNRYALKRAGLLWHRVSIGVRAARLNTLVITDLLTDLSAVDKQIIADLEAHLPLSKERIVYHLDRETLHFATDLEVLAPGFLTGVTDTIPGLYEALKSDKVVRQAGELDFLKKLFGGEIFYIKRDADVDADTDTTLQFQAPSACR
jgi:ATP-dependent protease ClpP protease subunit